MLKSVKSKIMILIVSCLLISNLFLGFFNYRKAQSIAIDLMVENNERELKNVSEYYFEKMIYDMEYVVHAWAEHDAIKEYVPKAAQRKMVNTIPDNFKDTYSQWMGLIRSKQNITWVYYALERDGSIFIAPVDETMPESYDARTRDWYKGTVAKKGEIFWTEPYLDAGDSGKILQTVSKAVYKDNVLKGVVGLDIELDKFTEILETLSISKNSFLFLLNQNNEIIAHNSDQLSKYGSKVIDAIGQSNESSIFEVNNQKYVMSWVPLSINTWKLVALTKTDFQSSLMALQRQFILVVIATILVGVWVTYHGAQNALKPLTILTEVTEKVASGDLSIRTSIHSKDEFSRLSKSFNHMLDQVDGLMKEREQNYLKTVRALANAIEASDKYTRGHCDRVGTISSRIAEKMNLSSEIHSNLEISCILHDIGKIGVPDAVLNKPSRLTESEFDLIKKHPLMGYEMLKDVAFLKEPAEILLQHHERIDGKGYPFGLKGEEIRLEAKILAVADTYDAMSSFRVYRTVNLVREEIIRELETSKETQLDGEIVSALIDLLKEEAFVFE